ncbi:hypothetical protein IMCC3317_22800 [Kordia antarctica]|uniref:Uncharacterized protein n=1 Tax=Kordia antarctica TaxID=1218801 RepID=A0A7L4ZK53_9FLAO|nr:hypothetical protein [Kordia antarctica]QHI36910.1 hypothetical protein IMCC3317_22800 [Kordia antarctica]
MKLLITFFSAVVLFTSSVSNNLESLNNDVITYEVVFDGSEGGLCFFTDSQDDAITVEDDENKLFVKFNQDANSFVGKTFTILLKPNKVDNGVYKAKSVLKLELK